MSNVKCSQCGSIMKLESKKTKKYKERIINSYGYYCPFCSNSLEENEIIINTIKESK